MRLTLSLIAFAAPVAACALASGSAAHAQGMGMDCFGNQGGRVTCVESRDMLFDRLDQKARETQAAANREKKLVRKVAQAVHDGRCAEIARAGADTFVAGSAIFGQSDYLVTINSMRAELATVRT